MVTKREPSPLPPLRNVVLAGIGSGLVYSLFCCPTELATIQCQAPESHWKKGPWRYLVFMLQRSMASKGMGKGHGDDDGEGGTQCWVSTS